jgi:hypothetical protein
MFSPENVNLYNPMMQMEVEAFPSWCHVINEWMLREKALDTLLHKDDAYLPYSHIHSELAA